MSKPFWNQINPIQTLQPEKRWGHSSCYLANQLIIFGGYAESTYFNDLWVFDFINLTWRKQITTGDIPKARSHATLNYNPHKNQLILFGGGCLNKQRFNSIYSLNWKTKEWNLIQIPDPYNIPETRTYHIAQIIGKYLVVFGGQNITDLNDLWIFNLDTKHWQLFQTQNLSVKPSARRFHTSCLKNNQLFIIGGCQNTYIMSKGVYLMDFNDFLKTGNIENLHWKQIKITNQNLFQKWGHSASLNSQNGNIYLFGGRSKQDSNSIVKIDINKNIAKHISVQTKNAPLARRRHTANFVGNSLVIFGGFNGAYFNDLHMIHIESSENESKKCETEKVINFMKLVNKNNKQAVSYFNQFKQRLVNKIIGDNISLDQIDQVLTSIALGYRIKSKGWKLIQSQLQQFLVKHNIFDSRQDKIKDITKVYSDKLVQQIQQSEVLQTLSTQNVEHNQQSMAHSNIKHDKNKNKNHFNKSANTESFNNLKQNKQIVFLNQQHFYRYLKDNLNIKKIDKCNPELNFNLKSRNQKLNQTSNQLQKIKEQSFYIQINQTQQIQLNPITILMNQYFINHFENNKTLKINNVHPKNVFILYVGIMFIQQSILVVPSDFKLQEWQKLLEFADYFCVNNLVNIIQRHMLQQVKQQNVQQLIKISVKEKMNDLMKKCSQLIIQKELNRFINLSDQVNKDVVGQKFTNFQSDIWYMLQQKNYEYRFIDMLMNTFEKNRLNLLLKYMNKLQQKNIKQKKQQNDNNKQNLTNNTELVK